MPLEEISLNLIHVADQILKDSATYTQNSKDSLEYVKSGRKYKLNNYDTFELVKETAKFLIVTDDYNEFKENWSLVSSYHILSGIGDVLQEYPELCLSIMGAARELELNQWYDLNSCCTLPEHSSYDPIGDKMEALKMAANITKTHVNNGLLILCASKINFFHTDHTGSNKLEGVCLQELVGQLFGTEALQSVEVYNAIRCFAYWGSIRGILYKLDLPGLWVDTELKTRFRNFPTPPTYLKLRVRERYPAGTSKYSLAKKALECISDSIYGPALHFDFEFVWLFDLCRAIEADPCKYHLRSSAKNLSRHPCDLSSLKSPDEILLFCAAVIHGSNMTVGRFLTSASKLPKKAVVKTHEAYIEVKRLNGVINSLQRKGKTEAEIREMIRVDGSLHSAMTGSF